MVRGVVMYCIGREVNCVLKPVSRDVQSVVSENKKAKPAVSKHKHYVMCS